VKHPPEVIQSWIETLRNEGRNLSKWEEDFLDSIEERFASQDYISERQEEVLERIYAERT
jgi:hypothetical protein